MAKAKKTENGEAKPTKKKKVIKKSVELTLNLEDKIAHPMNTIEKRDITELPKRLTPPTATEKIDSSFIQPTNDLTSVGFSSSKPIYIQIHSGNIYLIFTSGLISPIKYLRNRAFDDIQSTNPDALVLANNIIVDKNDSTALLEINLSPQDLESLRQSDNIAILDRPLPISRIKAIYVANEEIKKQIVATASTNDGGIIPPSIIISKFPPIATIKNSQTNIPSLSPHDYANSINRYNRMLGTFAFLKNYSLLLANTTNVLSTYPEHYFYALQAVNEEIDLKSHKNEKATLFYKELFGIEKSISSDSLRWLFDRIGIAKNFNDDDVLEFGNIFIKSVYPKEEYKGLREILNNLTRSLNRKKAVRDILMLPGAEKFSLYLFSLLRIYGNANTEERSISRIDMSEFLSPTYGEFVFAVLGYFYGYSNLRNFDEPLHLRDRVFSELDILSFRPAIKFELTSKLDYLVIESVYMNAFNTRTSLINEIDLTSKSIQNAPSIPNLNLPNGYKFVTKNVMGKEVYTVSRSNPLDDLITKLKSLPDQIPGLSDLGAFCYRNKVRVSFSNFGEILFKESKLKYFIFFKKEDILDAANRNLLDIEELVRKINNSLSYNEL